MKINQRGSIMLTSLLIVAVITVGGLIMVTGYSRKVDKKNLYSLRTGGRAEIASDIKNIPQFYDDFLRSNRASPYSRTIINHCIPAQSEAAPQDFSLCQASQKMESVPELDKAYSNSLEGKLPTINSGSFVTALPLVSSSEVPLSGTSARPALYDLEGAPCTTNCNYSLQSYMIKESNPGNPNDVILAFKLTEVKASGLGFSGKDEWFFVPLVKENWDAMPYSVTASVNRCPTGSFAFKINSNGTVICRDMEMNCFDGEMLVGISASGDALCVPEPLWPSPGLSFNQVSCDSWDYRPKTCPYALPDPNSSIKDVSVSYKRSKSSCTAGSSFGFNRTPPSLWVKKGCRATFNVETACNAGYAQDAGGVCVPVGLGSWSPDVDNAAYSCTNKPANSHYTGNGGGSNSCPWECDSSYQPIGGGCRWIPPTPTPAPSATPTTTPTPTSP